MSSQAAARRERLALHLHLTECLMRKLVEFALNKSSVVKPLLREAYDVPQQQTF
jgi:hypothetical protein